VTEPGTGPVTRYNLADSSPASPATQERVRGCYGRANSSVRIASTNMLRSAGYLNSSPVRPRELVQATNSHRLARFLRLRRGHDVASHCHGRAPPSCLQSWCERRHRVHINALWRTERPKSASAVFRRRLPRSWRASRAACSLCTCTWYCSVAVFSRVWAGTATTACRSNARRA